MSFLQPVVLLWRRLWEEMHHRRKVLGIIMGVLLFAAITLQVLYPSDEALPRAQLNSQAVGGETYEALVEQIRADFQAAEVRLEAGSLNASMPLSHVTEIEAETSARELTEYPGWQRALPLSLYIKRPTVNHLSVAVSEERLAEQAEALAEALSVAPQNAGLTIEDGELTVTPAATGQSVSADTVKELLSGYEFNFGTTNIAVASKEELPAIDDDDIAAIKVQAEVVLQRQIVLVAPDGREFTASPVDITTWLTVGTSEDEKPVLSVDHEQLAAYVARLNGVVGTAPGTAQATVVDGEEVGRTEASSGLAIASDVLVDEIARALLGEVSSSRLAIRLAPVPPNVVFDRSYTSSQKGLRAYVSHVGASEDIRIAVSQIGGDGWSAHVRAGEQTVAASTYKLYVATMLFSQAREGKLSLGDGMFDTTVAGCLDRMIVVSDNPCAEEFVSRFGGGNLNSYLYSKGLSRTTTFISDSAAQTTVADLEKILRGIEDGSIVGGSDRTRLLDAMSLQRFRAGVPTGSAGSVQSKVGFLWDYLNDAAIVRRPEGTYVIAIMTKGSSWQRVAEITREVERIMYND